MLGFGHARQVSRTTVEESKKGPRSFTVGICATGHSPRLGDLLDLVLGERIPDGLSLSRIVVVASACAQSDLRVLRRATESDTRVVLIEEHERKGKADAVNRIMAESVGEFLVFVNADAMPRRGAISRLLRVIGHDTRAGVVSGSPVVEPGGGAAAGVINLMWHTHNACSSELDGAMLANHGTDELMVARSDALSSLPEGVVNDGAYLAGIASLKGYRVLSVPSAAVRVDTPTRPVDVIRQRRRIVYGHIQIWKLVGEPPRTAETLVLMSPGLGFRIIVKVISSHPRLILTLPVAAVCEMVSIAGALLDSIGSVRRHQVWTRYGS